jgi:hypothetical protein
MSRSYDALNFCLQGIAMAETAMWNLVLVALAALIVAVMLSSGTELSFGMYK